MNGLTLLATGSAAGSRVVTNDDFAARMDTSDEWIYSRTGIHKRHFCTEEESAATLAEAAARTALMRAELEPEKIGCCIAATISADQTSPGIACRLQQELGLREDVPVLDVNAACSGFLYGMEAARGFLESRCPEGGYALVVGCEQLSRLLDMEDRSTCVLFGDGAGAAVVRSLPGALYESVQGARGSNAIEVPGSGDGERKIAMDGKAVFRFAVEALPKVLKELLEKSGKLMEEIDWVVCHQANSRIIDHCIRSMKADAGKFYKNMDHYGNTSAASIPMALDEMAEKGLLKAGQTIVLDGFGAGLTWAGALLQVDEGFHCSSGSLPATGPVGGVQGRDVLLTSSAPRWPSATPKTATPSSDLAGLSSQSTFASTEASQGPALGHPSATLSLGGKVNSGEFLIRDHDRQVNMNRKMLNEILGTKYPVVQGGMANIATGAFAAACSEAGALGTIGSGGMNAEQLRKEIDLCQRTTDKPFAVNLMLMHPQADEFAQIVVEMGVRYVTTGAGNPGKYMDAWKKAGIFVMPVVAAPILARHLEELGADAIIAEGGESGGHVGEMTTMTLVPQVCDEVKVPVIAAGGIADARQFRAAMALGACGVQVGTCLLAAEECPIHENYKNALIKAKGSDTIVTGRIGGTPVRVLKNTMSREYVHQERQGAGKEELEKFTLGSLRRAVFDGDVKTGSLMSGQTCGQIHAVRPAAEILKDLVPDAI